MIDCIVKKIKSCLPSKHRQYHIHEPIFKESDIKNITKCIDSTFVSTNGVFINNFIEKLNKITNCKYILLTNSGTSALFLSLKALDIDNCEVLIPSMTFVASANAIIHANGIPNFIDSSKNSLNICENNLEDYLSRISFIKNDKCINKKTGRRIKAIMIVHAYGNPVNVLPINKIAKKYHLDIIEDAAGALGSYHNKSHIGKTGRFSILSFNGNKIVTTGMGGAILFKNKKDYKNIKHLMSTARLPHKWRVEHDKVGYNLRMSNINAALGYGQLCRIKDTLKYKKELYFKYKNIFDDDKYCFLHLITENDTPNHWVTNIYLKDNYKKYHQNLIKALHNEGIIVRELWKPQHLNKMYKNMPRSSINNAVKHWKSGISLPSSYYK